MNLNKKGFSAPKSKSTGNLLSGLSLNINSKKKAQKKDVKALAIDFGSSTVKMVSGQKTGNRIKIDQCFCVELQKDVYENGHILNAAELQLQIRSAIESSSVKIKDVICTIQSSDLILRELILPSIDNEDMSQMIEYEIGQYLPIDINSYILQHKVLKRFSEDNIEKVEVLVAALSKEIVEPIYNLLISCGLTPAAMDIHSNCANKLINFNVRNKGMDNETYSNTSAIIDIGYKSINITIIENGLYKFNRIIKSGSLGIDEIIANNAGLSLKEAEQKRDVYITQNASEIIPVLINSTENLYVLEGENTAKSLITNDYISYLNDWTDQIDKIFKYYTSRNADNKIDEIILYGGGSKLKGIEEFFEQRISIPAYSLKAVEGIEFQNNNNELELPIFINAIGSLIRE